MRKVVFMLFFSTILGILSVKHLHATEVSGVISTTTTWALANSPYVVTGNILVSSNTTLTIEPGVQVKFDGFYYVRIDGTLIAIGTTQNKIVFTSNKATPNPQDWRGIIFTGYSKNTLIDQSDNYISGNTIQYAEICYGGVIYAEGSQPYLAYNYIHDNKSTTIPSYTSTSPKCIVTTYGGIVKRNIIINNSAGAIMVGGNIGNMSVTKILGNVIINNSSQNNWNGSILLYNEDYTCLFKNNIVAYNHGGLYISGGYNTIEHNIFMENEGNEGSNSIIEQSEWGSDFKYNTFVKNECRSVVNFNNYTSSITFTSNNIAYNYSTYYFQIGNVLGYGFEASNIFWLTTDTSSITNEIYNYSDDFNVPRINIFPIKTSPVLDAPIMPPNNVIKSNSEGGVKITWDSNQESNLAGYKIYYGSPTGYSFANAIDVGNATNYTLTSAIISDVIAVTAYNTNADGLDDQIEGNESWYSNSDVFRYTISGYIKNSSNTVVSGMTLTVTGSTQTSTTTDSNGFYQFSGLPSGDYTITPNVSYMICPQNRLYSSLDSNQNNQNYTSVLTWTSENGSTLLTVIAKDIDAAAGGVISESRINSIIYGAGIDIPAFALSTNTIIAISVVYTNEPEMETKLWRQGEVIDFRSINGVSTFNIPVTIKLPYSNDVINPYDLHVFAYNPINFKWEEIVVKSVDTSNRLVLAETNHLSYYALAFVTKDNLDEIKVYPNPLRVDRGGTQIDFSNLTLNATVKIFNLNGELIKKINSNDISAIWDTRNSDGGPVASGTYIYVITNPQGEKKTGKVAIIR